MLIPKATKELIGILKNRDGKTKDDQKNPKKIQELSFSDVYAKYNDSIRMMFALFADIWSGKLWWMIPSKIALI